MENSNYLYSDGDVLYIETRPNEYGQFHIAHIELILSGGIGGNSFVKVDFCTVENGVIESDWQNVYTADSSSSSFDVDYDLPRSAVLRIRLTRLGDGEPIKFERFQTQQGTYTVTSKPTPTLDNSMFSNLNRQYETRELEDNLFKKMYFRGIVPNYIERSDNLSKAEDGDYISLFSAIARFFALIMRFFKRWEKINDDEEMLKEILRNNGIQFNESEITFDELKFLVQNLYNEISKRGTLEIFRKAGDVRPDNSIVEIDGELMRMIKAKDFTEVLFESMPKRETGWYLRQSSPIYRGIPNNCLDLDKLHLPHYYSDISEWDGIKTFGTKTLFGSGEDKVMRFSGLSGIGRLSFSTNVNNYLIKADASMDYEITIGIRVVNASTGMLYASVEGFNADKVLFADAFTLTDKSQITGNFFPSQIPLDSFITDKLYYIRFIIKAYSSEHNSVLKLNIGRGNELQFNNPYVKYIFPTIRIDEGVIDVCNFHIRPLVRGTNINRITGKQFENCFSLGFLHASRMCHLYLRNRNATMTKEDVEDFINKFLLTYNGTNLITFIE